jgi:ribulose-phosphate 3-epimerase
MSLGSSQKPKKPRRMEIAPSILSADFARLGAEIADVVQGGADLLHLDVMDGHFVDNISFGPPVIRAVRKATDAFLETHLMISDPLRYAEAFVKAGSERIYFHIEAAPDPRPVLAELRRLGVESGLTINPTTPLGRIVPYLGDVDKILVMSVVPGFGGQPFMPEVLEKIRALRGEHRFERDIEVDGGITAATIGLAAGAGANIFVAGTAVFGAPSRAAAIGELRLAAERAVSTP